MTWYKMRHFRESVDNNKNGDPPFFVLGNPKTKSMLMSFQGVLGMGKGVYKP
jgi:hypothetical protein